MALPGTPGGSGQKVEVVIESMAWALASPLSSWDFR